MSCKIVVSLLLYVKANGFGFNNRQQVSVIIIMWAYLFILSISKYVSGAFCVALQS